MDLRNGTTAEESFANFTDEELTCYETWYSIIQHLNDKYPGLSELSGEHDIPRFGLVTARFLSTSGVPKDVLHDIWQVVDVGNEGVLNLFEFGSACRLVSFYQHEKILPSRRMLSRVPHKLAYFNISRFWDEAERADSEDASGVVDSYLADASHISECLRRFGDLSEARGEFLDGVTVFNSYINSALSRAELKRIWGFSDLDGDGRLSAAEFIIFDTLVRASTERGVRVTSGISKQSMLLIINKVIGMVRQKKEAAARTLASAPAGGSPEERPPSLDADLERLSDEIHDFRLARDVLARYKESDDQQIAKLNEKKLMLMTEHKDLLQLLNSKYSEIAKGRDLISYLYQDIKFLKETNGLLSALDLPKPTHTKCGLVHSGAGSAHKATPKSSCGKDAGDAVLGKPQSRKYNNWVKFPSADRPLP